MIIRVSKPTPSTEPVRLIGWAVAALTAFQQAILAGQPVSAAVLAALIVVATELQRSRVTPV